MGVICEGTHYHLVATSDGPTSENKRSTCRNLWLRPLGAPDDMKVDAEKALVSGAMQRGTEQDGTFVLQAAGEEHQRHAVPHRPRGHTGSGRRCASQFLVLH